MKRRLALAAILLVAIALRFTALGWGLRHLPHNDERAFVESVSAMLAAGDLDHRFYQYPGLFSYFLAGALRFLAAPQTSPEAYLWARGVNAAFGVLSVLLVYRLGRRVAGVPAGLFAAALLAVSPPEVRTAHMVRPDVTLHAFVLLALLAFTRLGIRLRDDVLSGLAIGAATAVKFSAPLVAPAYLVRRLSAEGFRWWKPLLSAAVSLLTFALLSPYTLLSPDSSAGLEKQFGFHYRPRPGALDYGDTAAAYGQLLLLAVGPAGLLLGLVGAWLGRRSWRDTLPLVVLPLTFVAVFSTADVRQERFLVPCLGAVCVLAGLAVQRVASWRGPAGLALAALALASPAFESTSYVRAVSRPINKDRAADWIAEHYPRGARVLVTAATDMGLDRSRFEVTSVHDLRTTRSLLLDEQDLLIAGLRDRAFREGLERIAVVKSATPYAGDSVFILAPAPADRPTYRLVDLTKAVVSGGTLATTAPLEVQLPASVTLGRIELVPAPDAAEAALELSVKRPGGSEFERVPFVPGRPSFAEQVAPRSRVFVLEGESAVALRLTPRGPWPAGWAGARLEVKCRN